MTSGRTRHRGPLERWSHDCHLTPCARRAPETRTLDGFRLAAARPAAMNHRDRTRRQQHDGVASAVQLLRRSVEVAADRCWPRRGRPLPAIGPMRMREPTPVPAGTLARARDFPQVPFTSGVRTAQGGTGPDDSGIIHVAHASTLPSTTTVGAAAVSCRFTAHHFLRPIPWAPKAPPLTS